MKVICASSSRRDLSKTAIFWSGNPKGGGVVWVSEAGDLAHTCPTHPFLLLLGSDVAGIVVRVFAMYLARKTAAACYVPWFERQALGPMAYASAGACSAISTGWLPIAGTDRRGDMGAAMSASELCVQGAINKGEEGRDKTS